MCKKNNDMFNVTKKLCVATSALRRANNSNVVLNKINTLGFFPKIISGEEMMCLSEEEEECQEVAKNKCLTNEYVVIREEVEDNTFENDKYVLTFKCK